MGEVNNIVCDYLGLPVYYADFWNGTVFRGKRKVKMWQLKRHDREYYKRKNREGNTGNIRRDVQMFCEGKKNILFGVEVMMTLDYTMPVRIMDYNVQELQRQIKDIRQKSRKKQGHVSGKDSSGTYLYGLGKTDKLMPVYTVGLYCGEGAYDGATDVLDMLNLEGVEAEYRDLLKNYKVKIYNLMDLKEERYESSLREIIAIFKRSKDREAMKRYYLEHKDRFQQLDEISIDTMGVLIGKRMLKLFPQEEGGLDMCKAFEDEREEGKAEGERIGREQGAFSMLCSLVKDGILRAEDAAKRMGMSEERFCSRMQKLQ